MAGALAELGANIVVCARKLERCEDACAELSELGVRTLALRCDVREPSDVQAVVDSTLAELGRVDVLVNNAGTSWGAPAEETPRHGWQKVIDVNLTGLFFMSQAAALPMIDQGGGTIINIASVAALRGSPPGTMDAVAYSASKGGVISLTRDLAWKWAKHGVRVNAIAPGLVPDRHVARVARAFRRRFPGRDPARPLRRPGRPERRRRLPRLARECVRHRSHARCRRRAHRLAIAHRPHRAPASALHTFYHAGRRNAGRETF